MATENDWKNYETLRSLVERLRKGEKDVYIPEELGQWFEVQAREAGEQGSIYSEGIATSIYAALMAYPYRGWQMEL